MPRRTRKDLELTSLQKAWADSYLENGSPLQACIDAGYQGNRKTLSVIGNENRKHPKIIEYIKQAHEIRIMPPEEVVALLSEQARGNIDFFINDQDEIDLDKARAAGAMRALKKYKTKTVTTERVERAIELHDPQAALDKLAKIHGLYKLPEAEAQGDDPTAEEVAAAAAALEAQRQGGKP